MSFSPAPGTLLSIYQYESVDISVSYSGTGTYTYTTTGSTDVISSLVSATSPIVRLTTLSYNGSVPKLGTESLVVNVIDAITKTPVASATYPVFFGSGRFLPFEYNPNISNGSNIVLYVNEAFKPIRFQTQQLGINSPSIDVNSVPTSLPVGLGLVKIASNIYDLSGTPAAQTVSRNYRFFSTGASNASFVVSNLASIVVNPERVVLNPPGPTLSFSSLAVGSSIPSTTITATYPSNAIGNLLYTWTTLPPGFFFTDPNGSVVSGNSMYSRDSNSTLTLTGTATIDTLNFFVANGNPFTTTLKAVRQTQPLISNALGFQFSFQPSVILTPPVVNTQYVGVPFIPSRQPLFNAYSSFGSTSPISTIFSPNLISDLSVNFNPSTATASLSGTPRLANVPGGFYTFRAVNATGLSTDISVNIPIALDTVSMSTTMNPVTTFILSRDSSNAKTGYYKAPLQFTAYAASGNSVTFSAPALSGTGLSLSNVTPNTVQIVGTPTRVTGTQSLVVTAVATNTNATTSLTRQFSTSNDSITINTLSIQSVQNLPLSSYQLTGSSLSERPIISFSGNNLPAGLFITGSGLIAGAFQNAESSSFTVNGSTGYASGSKSISYSVDPDNILLLSEYSSYSIVPGSTVSANIFGLTFSGGTVSNYQFLVLPNTYGLTLDSTTGHIGGVLNSGIPPSILPVKTNFIVSGAVGSLQNQISATLTTTNNPYLSNQYLIQSSFYDNLTSNGLLVSTDFVGAPSTKYSPVSTNTFFPSDRSPIDLRIRKSGTGIGGRFFMPYIHSYTNTQAYDGPVTIPYVAYSDNGVDFSVTPSNAFVDGSTFVYWNPATSSQVAGTVTLAVVNSFLSTGPYSWAMVGYRGSNYYNEQAGSYLMRSTPTLFRSSDDGLTWTASDFGNQGGQDGTLIYSRSVNGSNLPYTNMKKNPYILGGFATAYDSASGRLLVGGKGTSNYGYFDSGFNWNPQSTSSPFSGGEIAYFNTDVPSLFVATGSSGDAGGLAATTIAYSKNSGATWASVALTDTSFNVIGGDIASDGVGRWLATGVYGSNVGDGLTQFTPQIAYSTNGSNWYSFTLGGSGPMPDPITSDVYPFPMPLPIGPIYYDSDASRWHVFVSYGSPITIYEYVHNNTSSFTTGWVLSASNTTTTVTTDNTCLLAARPHLYVYSNVGGSIMSTLSFSSSKTGGPVLDYPNYTNLTLAQYVPMTSIRFSAHNSQTPTRPIYYYVATTDLPIGLSFNTQTQTLSGTPAHTGTSLVRIYLKDQHGVSQYNLAITVVLPTVTTRPVSGAGAYTSYIRQFTLADAAQNSRNNKVLTESDTLGEFMAPYGRDTISATIDPKCKNPLC